MIFYGDAFYGDAFYGDAFCGDAFYGDAFYGDAFCGDAFYGDNFMEHYFDLPGTDCAVRCKMYFSAAPYELSHRESASAGLPEETDESAAFSRGKGSFPDAPQMHFRHVILFCHGFAGHKDNAAAEKLAGRILKRNSDTALLIFNWPGHGDDAHASISLSDCDDYLNTVLQYIREVLRPEILDVCATSFGGYLILKYITDHRCSPFRRICLRCPAVVMAEVLTQTILTPEEAGILEAGGSVPAGFDRKVEITRAFLDSLRETGLPDRDVRAFADRICIVQGTADEVVPYKAVRTFAERNGLYLLSVEGADHRFLDPAKMDIVLSTFMEHLGV